ncbi:MAG: hypothetical protein QXD62_03760 [Candidatus Woesearchaeota archaeon]
MTSKNIWILLLSVFILAILPVVFADTEPQINITIHEYITQNITFDPFEYCHILPENERLPECENRTMYWIRGFIEIENVNPNVTYNDLWLVLGNISNIVNFTRNDSSSYRISWMYGPGTTEVETMGIYYDPNTGTDTFFARNAENYVVIHIPELMPGNVTRWEYWVDENAVSKPPLNISSNYSHFKIITGGVLTVNQSIMNVFDYGQEYQDTCIYSLNLTFFTRNGSWGSGSGNVYDYEFQLIDTNRYLDDTDNFEFSTISNRLWYFYAKDQNFCIVPGYIVNFSYQIQIPDALPITDYYKIMDIYASYRLNTLISGMNVLNIVGTTEGNYMNITKKITSDSSHLINLLGYNITWNMSMGFYTTNNIVYNVTKVSMWVSRREQVSESSFLEDIDNDTVTGMIPLIYNMSWEDVCYYIDNGGTIELFCDPNNPNRLNVDNGIINLTKPWHMIEGWFFNYTDPGRGSPILLSKVFYTVLNDNYQNISYSNYSENVGQVRVIYRTFNETDQYILQIYIVVDYYLQLIKNITKISSGEEDRYLVEIWVHNNGPSPTPQDRQIVIYDFVPDTFNILTDLTQYTDTDVYPMYSPTQQYTVNYYNTSVSGKYNGRVLRFVLNPPAGGAVFNPGNNDPNWQDENATFAVKYEVVGTGEYNFREIYLTGLDPMLIEGAGASIKSLIIEMLNVSKSNEWILLLITLAAFGLVLVSRKI